MKTQASKLAVVLLAALLTCSALADTGQTIATGVGRGIVNMVTCPAELAHHVVYDTAKMNVPGILTGIGKGTVFMLGRCVAGLSDFLTLGFMPEDNNVYSGLNIEPYIWDEQWLPPEEDQPKTVAAKTGTGGDAAKGTTKKKEKK